MRIASPRRLARWSLAALAVALAFPACGPTTLRGLLKSDAMPYASSCWARHQSQLKAVEELAYNPPSLRVEQWPKALPGGKHTVLTEAEFLRRVIRGEARNVLVTARGGVGKSTFAKAMEANLCTGKPTFRVDLNAEVAARINAGAKGNAIIQQIESQLALESRVSDRDSFRAILKRDNFVVLLDSLDEVPASVRPKVVAQINQLTSTYAKTAQVLVFARPAVLLKDYGIERIDARVHLPPLTCGRAKATLRWTAKSDDAEKRTQQFIQTYFLDRQAKKRERCYYPYMAAYRDLQVVQRLAAKFNPKGNLGGLTASLASVHQTIVAERLRKELAALKWSGAQILASLDHMVRQGGRDDGTWNLVFTMARCRESVGSHGGGAVQIDYICEKMLQSALFERIEGAKEWRFAHKNVADLFLARWVDREIKRMGGSCDVVSKHADWLGSKDVAGYLVGQPTGRSCLLQAAAALCKAEGGFERHSVDLLYKGLPVGEARAAALATAKQAAKKAHLKASSCAMKTLLAL